MPYIDKVTEFVHPQTVWVYHRNEEMNQTELDRRIKELRRENPAFAETMTDFKQVIGTTRQIGHIPPGYRDMQPGYRSDLLLIVRQVSRVFELDPLPTPVHKNWW